MKTFVVFGLGPVAAALMLGACAPYPTVEEDFGNSVRHMNRAQAVQAPVDSSPVETGDGQRLNGVVEAYRSGASSSDSGRPPVVVDFGGAPQ